MYRYRIVSVLLVLSLFAQAQEVRMHDSLVQDTIVNSIQVKSDTLADTYKAGVISYENGSQDSILNASTSNIYISEVDHSKYITIHDSLKELNSLQGDSIRTILAKYDSLFYMHKQSLRECIRYADSLTYVREIVDSLHLKVERLKKKTQLLQPLNKELNQQIKNLEDKIAQQSQMLDQQIIKIKEKEQLFKEKELIYQNAIQESKIDLVKLEGQLQSKNSELAGKDREIELLAESIAERKADILLKNKEIEKIKEKRSSEVFKLDTLRDHIAKTEKTCCLLKQI
jgi:chromosome segregation ATPase